MLSKTRGALLAALLLGTESAAAQSLGEVAAREKQRRAAVREKSATRSFSDESLTIARSGWRSFGGPELGFTVSFPAAPAVEQEVDIEGALRVPRTRYVASDAGGTYTVVVKPRPKGGVTDESLLNRLQSDARIDANGEILETKANHATQCPGVEFSMQARRADALRELRAQAFACAQRLYTVVADHPAADGADPPPTGDDADLPGYLRFLRSFVLEE